jgi:hypothetical protein
MARAESKLPLTCTQLSSDKSNRNVDQDEIDIEWLNGNPAQKPGAVWTNHWVNGKRAGDVEHVAAYTDAWAR